MTGKQIRTTVRALEKSLLPQPANWDLVYQKDAAAKEAYRFFYNCRSARPLPDSSSSSGLLSPLLGHWPPGAARLNRLSDLETDKDVTVTLKFALLVLCSVCSYKGRTGGRLNIRGVHLSLSHKGRIFSGPFSGSRVVYHDDVQCGWDGRVLLWKKVVCFTVRWKVILFLHLTVYLRY